MRSLFCKWLCTGILIGHAALIYGEHISTNFHVLTSDMTKAITLPSSHGEPQGHINTYVSLDEEHNTFYTPILVGHNFPMGQVEENDTTNGVVITPLVL